MNTQVIVAFCLFVLVFGASCESTSLEQSNSLPLTFVYAVYPFYNTETLLQVWKNDESAEVYANVVTVNPGEQELTVLNAGSTISRNETIDSNGNRNPQVLKNDAENVNVERLSQTRQQLRGCVQRCTELAHHVVEQGEKGLAQAFCNYGDSLQLKLG
ncbi:hypothetical protein HZH68_007611 [Vespula germanica]|uniref:Uncharacterized protein n=1 Tax=Vespula germanica TaxID=30212 RepID=A0A834KDB5_VESGE|nr:hypothetical protein HZH68_007611 [Vespula germanica]